MWLSFINTGLLNHSMVLIWGVRESVALSLDPMTNSPGLWHQMLIDNISAYQ